MAAGFSRARACTAARLRIACDRSLLPLSLPQNNAQQEQRLSQGLWLPRQASERAKQEDALCKLTTNSYRHNAANRKAVSALHKSPRKQEPYLKPNGKHTEAKMKHQ